MPGKAIFGKRPQSERHSAPAEAGEYGCRTAKTPHQEHLSPQVAHRDSISGVANIESGSGNRQLEVTLGSGRSRDIQEFGTGGGADYWIYCLGPVNDNGRYDWAVGGGAKKDFIFLLTRENTVPEQTNDEMLSCARREGLPVRKFMYRQWRA